MSSTSTLPFELNEDLWFDDGDICVCARRFDSGVLCLYKLYRDILAVHSSVLLNLLHNSPRRRQVHIGDTPYAYLDDDALDLERFFVAIYYPTYFLFWKHDARSFSCALPVFRIALKYKANNVIESLASQLEQDWPKTISEWDASQSEETACFGPVWDHCPEYRSWARATVIESTSAIQVAHIADMPGVLSTAYYQLSRISSSDVSWQNTISQFGPPEEPDRKKGRSKRESGSRGLDRQTLLSKEDLRRLALGRENLTRYMGTFKKRLPKELALHPRCAEAWNTGLRADSDDVLIDLLEFCSADMFPGLGMCSDCRSRVNERGRRERERIWELLPKFFCLSVRRF